MSTTTDKPRTRSRQRLPLTNKSAPIHAPRETPPDLMTRKQAAAYLHVSYRALEDWALKGKYGLKYVKVGRRVFYERIELDRWLQRRTVSHSGEADLLDQDD